MANNNGTNAAAVIGGAVVGAGIGIAATKILSDEKTRKKLVATAEDVKDKMVGAAEELGANKNVQTFKKAGKLLKKRTTQS